MPLIMYGDEESAWTTVHQTKLLAGETHCGRVYDRHHLSYILSNEPVEQTLVAILKYAIVSLGNPITVTNTLVIHTSILI